jgi:alpha-glucosidase (family GH31 glycosyl hydrolase)
MLGTRDDELYIRWLQFGVFSPIMRLHSSNMLALGKEPWKYSGEVCRAAKYWLNLRHKLIPYIYTMDHRTHTDGVALCEPMYYSYPENESAYNVPNQFMFGSELMICPITKPNDKKILMGSVEAWIPEGRWTDIFTLKSYTGEKTLELFRDTATIPVLAKEGAIIPMSADEGNSSSNPESFEIWAFSGNGEFVLKEDDGSVDFKNHTASTKFEISYENGKVSFTVNAAEGDTSVIPHKRNYTVRVRDLMVDDKELVFEIRDADITEAHTVSAENASRITGESKHERAIRIFSRWQGFSLKKEICCRLLGADGDVMKNLGKLPLPKAVRSAINEELESE